MTIELDDAGRGCALLGEVFVARRLETNEYTSIYVEKEDSLWELRQLLFSLNPKKEEEIRLCRGRELDSFAHLLKQEGYSVKRIQVEGETNDLAEALFLEQLRSHGLPKSIVLEGKEYGRFYTEVTTWYETLYQGKGLRSSPKPNAKKKEIDFVLNRVYNYPNLMEQLFYPETEER